MSLIKAQERVGEWKALTSVMEIRDIVYLDDAVYAATGGGIFEIKNNKYSVFTTIDGLKGVDLSAIAVDFRSQLWIGGNSPYGFVQIFDPLDNHQINHFDFGLNSIVNIQLNDKTCWILYKDGQELGLMKFIFDMDWQYRDSYANYPLSSGKINCFSANDSIVYAGMTGGLYYAHINENMKDPNNWNALIPDFDHEITSIALDDYQLSFTTSNKIFKYDINTAILNEIEFSFELQDIHKHAITTEGIWFTDGDRIFLKAGSIDYLINDDQYISDFIYKPNQLIAGSNSGFLFIEKSDKKKPNFQKITKFFWAHLYHPPNIFFFFDF